LGFILIGCIALVQKLSSIFSLKAATPAKGKKYPLTVKPQSKESEKPQERIAPLDEGYNSDTAEPSTQSELTAPP